MWSKILIMECQAEYESAAAEQMLEFIERAHGDLPARIVAGAAMRLAAALAVATFGPVHGPIGARQALDNVLIEPSRTRH